MANGYMNRNLKHWISILLETLLICLISYIWFICIGDAFILERDYPVVLYFFTVSVIFCIGCTLFSKFMNGKIECFKFIDIVMSIPFGIFFSGLVIVLKILTLFIVIDLQFDAYYSLIDASLKNYMFILHEIFFIPVGFFLSRNVSISLKKQSK